MLFNIKREKYMFVKNSMILNNFRTLKIYFQLKAYHKKYDSVL